MAYQLRNGPCFLTLYNTDLSVFSQVMTEAANRMCTMLGNHTKIFLPPRWYLDDAERYWESHQSRSILERIVHVCFLQGKSGPIFTRNLYQVIN